MFLYPPSSISHLLPNSIYLLQSTLPESRNELRDKFAQRFKTETGSKVKRIQKAGLLIHWDQPYKVVHEIRYCFK